MLLTPIGNRRGISSALRIHKELVGVKDGANPVFTTEEPFIHTDDIKIELFWNLALLHVDRDYTVAESGGPGTGYDTVNFLWTKLLPRASDIVAANYVAALT
jgi:hypothetical protein